MPRGKFSVQSQHCQVLCVTALRGANLTYLCTRWNGREECTSQVHVHANRQQQTRVVHPPMGTVSLLKLFDEDVEIQVDVGCVKITVCCHVVAILCHQQHGCVSGLCRNQVRQLTCIADLAGCDCPRTPHTASMAAITRSTSVHAVQLQAKQDCV